MWNIHPPAGGHQYCIVGEFYNEILTSQTFYKVIDFQLNINISEELYLEKREMHAVFYSTRFLSSSEPVALFLSVFTFSLPKLCEKVKRNTLGSKFRLPELWIFNSGTLAEKL
jgi:hypothetical protein